MSAKVIPFRNGEFELAITQFDGTFRVPAPALARALGFREAFDLLRSIPDDEKGSELVRTPGGEQRVGFVTESGFYRALGQRQTARITDSATREQVERFQTWVYSEVLPAIRRHGGYLTPDAVEAALTDPDFIIRLATDLKTERAKRRELEAKTQADAPKVLFADAVAASDGTILIGELAKILRGNGVLIGQNRLFARLREDGYLIRREGSDYNTPTQRAMELGLFRVKETAITHADGHVTISKTTKVTGKGQQYFVRYFLTDAKAAS